LTGCSTEELLFAAQLVERGVFAVKEGETRKEGSGELESFADGKERGLRRADEVWRRDLRRRASESGSRRAATKI
jgi:hypothetical protein